MPAAALADLFEQFEGAATDREAAVALLRNCLTHPEAARVVRDEVMCERIDAELRAALVGACLLGLALSRHVLEVPQVAAASRGELERLVEPALRAIVEAGR